MNAAAIEHLVIGGGPAGAMAALRLAQAGRVVVLLERERAAHSKVCGEFLSHEALGYLRQIGIHPEELGAVPIDRVRLAAGTRAAEIPLPFPALSLSRRLLDEAMLALAGANGCDVRRGAEVDSLRREREAWMVRVRGRETLRARNVFLASGKHDLRGWARGPGLQSDLVGFKMYWRLMPDQVASLRAGMELFLFPGGYGGLSLVESDAANLCLVVKRERLRIAGGWAHLLDAIRSFDARLAERLLAAEPINVRPLAISPIPYGYRAPHREDLWRVGDQAAVIPSFTGDGMSIALHSGALAAQMFLAGKTPGEYLPTLHAQLKRGMKLATMLSQIMVTSAGRSLAPGLLGLAPGTMGWIAHATRIDKRDLVTCALQ
ncbi:MAG TPA: FAD-dependent monooxygenase [Terracidiphilus sp.]|nr:FAD-dependent monooxygenase [Terracidiphilus sp.]